MAARMLEIKSGERIQARNNDEVFGRPKLDLTCREEVVHSVA